MFITSELHPLTITLAMFGKIGSAAAFTVAYTFSLELFPTVVRNGAMGASSCVARLGSMLAPYIAIGVCISYTIIHELILRIYYKI